MEIQETIEFNGVLYRLMGTRKYYLSQSRSNRGRKNPKGLHVAIWEFHHKAQVPSGWHVHHKDGNTFNNDISNLECIPSKQHYKIPKQIDIEAVKRNLARIRPLTRRWHRSPEGRLWHSQNSRKQWANPSKFNCVCIQCGDAFQSVHSGAKFCSDACVMAAGRESGRWNIDKQCFICGKTFTSNKYEKQLTCSRSCGTKLQHQRRKAGL